MFGCKLCGVRDCRLGIIWYLDRLPTHPDTLGTFCRNPQDIFLEQKKLVLWIISCLLAHDGVVFALLTISFWSSLSVVPLRQSIIDSNIGFMHRA
jgi:hypothetical protein